MAGIHSLKPPFSSLSLPNERRLLSRRLTELLTLEPFHYFYDTKFSILQSKPSVESAINSADLSQHSLIDSWQFQLIIDFQQLNFNYNQYNDDNQRYHAQ